MLCFTNLCSTLMPRSMASLFVTALGSSTIGVPITPPLTPRVFGVFGAVDARDPWVFVAPITRRHVSSRVVGGVGMADEGTADTGLDPPFVPFMDPGRDRIDLDGDGAGVSNRTV